MMDNKQEMLALLRDEFARWQEFVAGKREIELVTPDPNSEWSLKDILAHLRGWQQISIARLEAAIENREPNFPAWVAELGADWEHHTRKTNALLYENNRDKTWADVYGEWHTGFTRFLELAQQIPEPDYFEIGKYAWLNEYPLAAVLRGSYNHHHEHLQDLSGS